MAKKDKKKPQGSNLNENSRFKSIYTKNTQRDRVSRDIEITLSIPDQSRLKSFMFHELKYYNNINDAFYSAFRSFPDVIPMLDKWDRLYNQLAYEGINIRQFMNKSEASLPDSLKPHNDLIFGKNEQGKRKLNESIAILLETLAYKNMIHPEIRKNIASEILKFYREQGKAGGVNRDNMYSVAPTFLEKLDNIAKRHIQIPRKICQVVWNNEDEISKVSNPYTIHPVEIPVLNLNEEPWNILILHQEPGRIPISTTPWIATIKNDPRNYLVRYLDQDRSHSQNAFSMAKSRN
jgi:hypothetical protein